MGQSRAASENPVPVDHVYQPEPVYPGMPDVELSFGDVQSSADVFDDEMIGLGPIQVLKTPTYWSSMMMPG